MQRSDDEKKRIDELKKLKPDDFVLRDGKYITQGDVEDWADAMGEFDLSGEQPLNLPRMRRMSFQAAYRIGWFTEAPKLEPSDFVLLPPLLVSRVGDAVLEFYNKIVIPDTSFT